MTDDSLTLAATGIPSTSQPTNAWDEFNAADLLAQTYVELTAAIRTFGKLHEQIILDSCSYCLRMITLSVQVERIGSKGARMYRIQNGRLGIKMWGRIDFLRAHGYSIIVNSAVINGGTNNDELQ